jgi:hypothetical protein
MAVTSDDDAGGELYDLAENAPMKPEKIARADVVKRPAVLPYRSASVQAGAKAEPEKIKNLYMPLWLLGGGIVIEIVAALFKREKFEIALMGVGIEIIVGTVFMLAGVLVAAKFRGIEIGSFWTAVFKLSAISVAPSAGTALVHPILMILPLGWVLGFILEFVLYFALLGALFDLDESDTWYCVCVIFIIHVAVYILFLLAAPRWF